MQQYASKYFARKAPPPTLGSLMGSIGQNSTFSEHGHVAYQIKGNHEMQQHGSKYFARRPSPHQPTTLGDGKKSKFNFSGHGHVAYQINEIANAATW